MHTHSILFSNTHCSYILTVFMANAVLVRYSPTVTRLQWPRGLWFPTGVSLQLVRGWGDGVSCLPHRGMWSRHFTCQRGNDINHHECNCYTQSLGQCVNIQNNQSTLQRRMQLHPLYSSAPRRLTNGWKGKREIQKVFNFHIRTSVDSFTLSQTWLTLAIPI